MAFIRERLIRKNGTGVASATGLKALVWRAQPSAGNPNPNQALTGLTTDADGDTNWEIAEGALVAGDPAWVAVIDPAAPQIFSIKRVIPVFE